MVYQKSPCLGIVSSFLNNFQKHKTPTLARWKTAAVAESKHHENPINLNCEKHPLFSILNALIQYKPGTNRNRLFLCFFMGSMSPELAKSWKIYQILGAYL